MLCNESLENHYKTNFLLMQKFGYSLTELDNMIPFEREIYIGLLIQHLEKKRQQYANSQ
jgi:hypothetical protein